MTNEIITYINKTPELISVLYDLSLMPEQVEYATEDYNKLMTIATGMWELEERIKKEKDV